MLGVYYMYTQIRLITGTNIMSSQSSKQHVVMNIIA